MALRRKDLNRIGGFAAIADYVADDYQLAKRVGNVILSTAVVSTHLDGSWTQVWDHQVRWARTIRLSRSGYYGLPIANTTLWVILALVTSFPLWAALLLAVRLVVGLAAGAAVLRDGLTLRLWWLMPVRDVLGFAVWIAGAVGSTVVWRGRNLKLNKYGRIS
jgi:ceramide glucosyltransferase